MRGDRLAELRKDSGITQREFAQQLHVSLNTVSSWERGLADPDDETKILLARRFNVSLDYLMGLSEHPSPEDKHPSLFVFVQDLSPSATRELSEFLIQFQKKYHL